MEITIFKELTTNEYLDQLKTESEKYTGLYVDMNNAPERKYVRDKAYDIQQLIKKLDRSRIDKSKAYKLDVEKEATDIKERLENANLPFTLLLDEHKAERAKILADKKANEAAKELVIQKAKDEEEAYLIDKVMTFEVADAKRVKAEYEEQLKNNAAKQAEMDLIRQQASDAENKELQRLGREADKEHVQEVKTGIYFVLVNNGISENDAKAVIRLATNNELPNLVINY